MLWAEASALRDIEPFGCCVVYTENVILLLHVRKKTVSSEFKKIIKVALN